MVIAIRDTTDRNIFLGCASLMRRRLHFCLKPLFIRVTAGNRDVLPVRAGIKVSKKMTSFLKKIWRQAKAGYLCAPLLKKAIVLKKINDD